MNSWSDYGFPDKIYLAPPRPALNGLTAALNERLSVSNSGKINPPPPLSPLNAATMKTWFTNFEATLNYVIPLYVDHTVNHGDFTGLEAIPKWTNKAIYESLSETEILYKDCLLAPQLWSKYLLQKYRVINLLRWAESIYTQTPKITRKAPISQNLSANTWSELAYKFSNGSWSGIGYGWPIEYQIEGGSTSYYSVSNENTGQAGVRIYQYCYDFTVDCYCIPFLESRLAFQPFEIITNEAQINKLNLMKTLTKPQTESIVYLFDFKSFFLEGKVIPENKTIGFSANPGPFVAKFEERNGFTFRGKDWN